MVRINREPSSKEIFDAEKSGFRHAITQVSCPNNASAADPNSCINWIEVLSTGILTGSTPNEQCLQAVAELVPRRGTSEIAKNLRRFWLLAESIGLQLNKLQRQFNQITVHDGSGPCCYAPFPSRAVKSCFFLENKKTSSL